MKILLISFIIAFVASTPPKVSFNVLDAGTDATLIAISKTSKALWISGTKGTIIKSSDDGTNWSDNLWKGPDSLQFRDVHAFDDEKALVMSIGSGASSQIFSTEDGGNSWSQTYQMQHPDGFLDCMGFWDEQRGIAYGDAFDGYPFILTTTDGGQSWERVLPKYLPTALEGEGGFASSGTCVTTGKGGYAWIGTGNGRKARVLISSDYGKSWQVTGSPLVSGEAAGITSIDFLEDGVGFITGGDLTRMKEYTDNCAITNDFGKTWELVSKPVTKGALYGLSLSKVDEENLLFVCGPNGIDFTLDHGRSWTLLDTANYWTVHLDSDRSTGWAAGKNGRIIRISVRQ